MKEHSLNPTLQRLLKFCRMDRTWVRGEGVWLFDSNGRRFIDCYAQYGAVALGHNAKPVNDAVRAMIDRLEPAMVQPYRAQHAEGLADYLTRVAPGSLSRCIFATSGAEAAEGAIKLVRARTGRPLILSATGSFHGKTLGALALTGQPRHAEGFGPLPPGFEHVPFGDIETLAARLAEIGNDVAAVFLEPIQGEGGIRLPPAGYLAAVKDLCRKYGTAFVLDEIQTGLGRTGRLFACEHDGISPDVMILGKGLGGGLFPLSACLSTPDFWDEGFALRHSSTMANNNAACRVGIAVLDTLINTGLCQAVEQRGKLMQTGLAKLAKRYPRIIGEVRGRGLLGAIELRPLNGESTFLSLLAHQGLYSYAVAATIAELASVLVLPTLGPGNILRVAPPLVISDRELKAAMDGIGDVFNLLNANPVKTIATALGMLERSTRRSRKSLPEKPIRGIAPHLGSGSATPDYAFIVHRTSIEDLPTTEPYLSGLSKEQHRRFCSSMGKLPPGVLLQAPAIRSRNGAIANGVILAMPLLPSDLARQGRRSVCEDIRHLVDLARKLGAKIVGLGGYTVPYSRRGLDIVGRGPAITTGNALTAGISFLASQRLLAERGLAIDEASVAVVGVAGSVGMLCAKLLARENPRLLTLIGNPARGIEPLRRLAKNLAEISRTRVVVSTDIDRLSNCQLVMSATAAGRPILDGAAISPGTVVCDIARPPDTSPQLRARRDLTVIEGGRIKLPDPSVKFGVGNLQGLPAGVTVACLAETILLSLEGENRDTGIGDDVPLSLVDHMLKLAEKHGFCLEEADQLPATRRPRPPARPLMEAHLSAI